MCFIRCMIELKVSDIGIVFVFSWECSIYFDVILILKVKCWICFCDLNIKLWI